MRSHDETPHTDPALHRRRRASTTGSSRSCFILAALSGLAFFHPALFFLTDLFGGGPWTRILHPFIGVVMFAAFCG